MSREPATKKKTVATTAPTAAAREKPPRKRQSPAAGQRAASRPETAAAAPPAPETGPAEKPPGPHVEVPIDAVRLHALALAELARVGDALRASFAAAAPPPPPPPPASTPLPPEQELLAVLRRAHEIVLQHPMAAQAAFSALVAEGRRFALTDEGRRWSEALLGSDLLDRARRVWEATSLNLLEPGACSLLPSSYLEAVARAMASPGLDGALRDLQATLLGGGPRAGRG